MTDAAHDPAWTAVRHDDELGSLDIAALELRYRSGELDPMEVVDAVYDRIEGYGGEGVWISLVGRAEARRAAAALGSRPDGRPLWGIPFAVKDNLDVAGMPTTAACPAFARTPGATATAVRRLLDAGALLIGKTNLDQFATGLNGTRSPYGIPSTPFDARMISGGSSSGSGVAVSAGLVSFALGTDTAGSGRVPAAFTNTVGVKPSRGLVSSAGMLPACRSLDCVSVVALTVDDGTRVLDVMAGHDPSDAWSRALPPTARRAVPADPAGLTFAVPAERDLGLSEDYRPEWDRALARLEAAGATLVTVDLTPFLRTGAMLYGGPWLAERYGALEDFLGEHPDDVHPAVRAAVSAGPDVTGVDVFRGTHLLRVLRRQAESTLADVSALLVPTSPYTTTIEALLADPVAANAALGRFTTFANLLDLAGVAVPVGLTAAGLPFGVTVLADAGRDAALAAIAASVEQLAAVPLGATGHPRPAAPAAPVPPASGSGVGARAGTAAGATDAAGLPIAVVGAHLEGMPLHPRLLELGATFVSRTTTAPEYRLYALSGTVPPKPGLVRVGEGGAALEVEVYRLPGESVAAFLAEIGAPLGIGTVRLVDGSELHGFVCEAIAVADAEDITRFGGWRGYLAAATAAAN
ncbi:allophanate hydrolase [Agromyces tardus]